MTDQMPAQNLEALSAELLEKARGAHSGRAAKGVFAGTYLRQALLTLREGAELAEHDSPPEATLHVVKGQVRMVTADESWELSAGELIAIPPQKHSVEALTEHDRGASTTIHLDLGALGEVGESFEVEDLLTGERFTWGRDPFVILDPAHRPAHVLRIIHPDKEQHHG